MNYYLTLSSEQHTVINSPGLHVLVNVVLYGDKKSLCYLFTVLNKHTRIEFEVMFQ